jgi:hypothetical protein
MKKICTRCKKKKDIKDFIVRSRSLSGRGSWCKACGNEVRMEAYYKDRKRHRDLNRVRIARSRAFIRKYLEENPCVDCGFSNADALDFDHVRGKKRITVTIMGHKGWSIDVILAEIGKCEVRCSNCHRIRHAKERRINKEIAGV